MEMTSRKNSKLMRVVPEFEKWVHERRKNIERKISIPVKVSLADTQRIIALTQGIDLNLDAFKRLKRKK